MSDDDDGGDNQPAEIGTCAHELGEFSIRYGVNTDDCVGMTFNNIQTTKEMADHVKLYTGFADSLAVKTGVKPLLEQRVIMLSLGRKDVYGTADLILIDLANRTLYIGDLKYGYVPVNVVENRQLIAYMISTLDTFELWDKIDTIVTTIIQPRKQHIDGPIRQHTYSINEAKEWQVFFKAAVEATEDPNAKCVPGDHCKYCKVKQCRARFERLLEFMYPDSDSELLSDGEVNLIYKEAPMIRRFLDTMESQALANARKGGNAPDGYKLVNAIQRAKVNDEKALIADCEELNLDTSKLYEKKLKSKTAVRKLLPAEIVNRHWQLPPTTTTLAPLTDNRPAINTRSAAGIFKPVNQSAKSAVGIFTAIK